MRMASEALSHCIFWRPDATWTWKSIWYANPNVRSGPIAGHASSMRWGRLVEQVQQCLIGRMIGGAEDVRDYIKDLRMSMATAGDAQVEDQSSRTEKSEPSKLGWVVYLLLIQR